MPFKIVEILGIYFSWIQPKYNNNFKYVSIYFSIIAKGYKKIAFKNIYTYVVGSLPRLSCN